MIGENSFLRRDSAEITFIYSTYQFCITYVAPIQIRLAVFQKTYSYEKKNLADFA